MRSDLARVITGFDSSSKSRTVEVRKRGMAGFVLQRTTTGKRGKFLHKGKAAIKISGF